VEEKPVQVVTPQSPLGEALLGKKVGDRVRVEIRGGVREYRLLTLT
jgi:transcription elongation GreA/GreB family factor